MAYIYISEIKIYYFNAAIKKNCKDPSELSAKSPCLWCDQLCFVCRIRLREKQGNILKYSDP